jgi:hypothetical protein
LIRRFASTTSGRPSDDLHVIRTTPFVSSSDSIAQPKYSSTSHPLLDDAQTVLEMVEHFAFSREVGAMLAEGPLDVSGGEHRMWLVQPHVRVGVDPHAADALPAVDQDDLLFAREVPAGDEQGIEPREAGPHDAHIAAFNSGHATSYEMPLS